MKFVLTLIHLYSGQLQELIKQTFWLSAQLCHTFSR